MEEAGLDTETIQHIYEWVDSIPLSRPKRNIARDFSDGVLFAEILHYYNPKVVELHNYSAANSIGQKRYNWDTLQKKPLRKLRVKVEPELIENIVQAKPFAIEQLLLRMEPILVNGVLPSASMYTTANMSTTHKNASMSGAILPPVPKAFQSAGPATSVPPSITPSVTALQEQINELRDMNMLLESKVTKLQQLVHLKDERIRALVEKLEELTE